ncbi:hypothetical protein, partial [Bacillus subtilis]|uniref:hypothetical protein n=1 Tax=Bacillus subtilis TaxID=1423 RepID=UPI00202A3D14
SSNSLSLPIPYKAKDHIVYLNLHQKPHPPHPFLPSTTRSPKSEFLHTYIFSLPLHFHPRQAAFLLIHDKAARMA